MTTWRDICGIKPGEKIGPRKPSSEISNRTVESTNIIPGSTIKTKHRNHIPGVMNKLEGRYAEYLEGQKLAGEIIAWQFEPIKFRLAKATFYSPDFLVIVKNNRIRFDEVKGYWEDDARVKIKVAANLFPWFEFYGVTFHKKLGWQFEPIG